MIMPRVVLDEISVSRAPWSLDADEIFGPGIHLVSGDVGSGKSTLALVMACMHKPDQGRVTQEGIGRMMLSFQFPEFHVTCLTVAEECRSWDLDPGEMIRSAGLSVSPDAQVLSMSRGELKRLHLACVFGRAYDLLLLDEPFSSLDCEEKEKICRIISTRNSGITVIFSHEQSIFPHIDFLWEIREGKLVFCGPVPEALVHWEHAPALVKTLVCRGNVPRDLTPESLVEAACRTSD